MKSFGFTASLIVGLIGFLHSAAALQIENQQVSIVLSDSYVSRYVWRGQDLYPDNDAAHQPSIDVTFEELLFDTNLTLNLWGSFALNKGHEDAEELDYSITFSRDLTEDFSLALGYTYFDFPNDNKNSDVQEPWIELSLQLMPYFPVDVGVSMWAGYDFKAASGGPDEGWYYSWGFDAAIELPDISYSQIKQTLTLGIINWGQDGVGDMDSNVLYATELNVAVDYELNDFTITPNIHYIINHDNAINEGKEELWGGIELSYTF